MPTPTLGEIGENARSYREDQLSNSISHPFLSLPAPSRKLTGRNTHENNRPLEMAQLVTTPMEAVARDGERPLSNVAHLSEDFCAKGECELYGDGQGGSLGHRIDESQSSAENAENRDPEAAAFWTPQATPDGQLFYSNTLTGISQMELPLQTPTSTLEQGPGDRLNIVDHSPPLGWFDVGGPETPRGTSPQSPTNDWHDLNAFLSPRNAPIPPNQLLESISTKATDSNWPLRPPPALIDRSEKELALLDLKDRIDDWKGHNINEFGDLLLWDNLLITKPKNIGRTYQTYLFERILLLCCTYSKAIAKSWKLSKHSGADQQLQYLRLKGRIFIKNIIDMTSASIKGYNMVQIFFRGSSGIESFKMHFDKPDDMTIWSDCLDQRRFALKSRLRGGVVFPSTGGFLSSTLGLGRHD